MRIIINENERGFLYKNGVYKRMLGPGRQRIWLFLGERLVKFNVDGILDFPEMNLPVLRKDAEFEKSVAIIEVPDDRLAAHFVDGRISDVLKPGTYVFWNIYKKHTFEILDITEPESAGKLPVRYMAHAPSSHYVEMEINDGEAGLLFYNGVFQRVLGGGQHFFWDYNVKVSVQTVDTRVQPLDISGQEILTADKVSLRVNDAGVTEPN
jgi:hypothetical protein